MKYTFTLKIERSCFFYVRMTKERERDDTEMTNKEKDTNKKA